jgi:hypothetical protein
VRVWGLTVVDVAPMARPKRLHGGRPEKQDGPTSNVPIRVSERRKARWQAFAKARGQSVSDAVRDVMDGACDAAEIPEDPREPAE